MKKLIYIALFFLPFCAYSQNKLKTESGGNTTHWKKTPTGIQYNNIYALDNAIMTINSDNAGLPAIILHNKTGSASSGLFLDATYADGPDQLLTEYALRQWSNGTNFAIDYVKLRNGVLEDSRVMMQFFGETGRMAIDGTVYATETNIPNYMAGKLGVGIPNTQYGLEVAYDSIVLGNYRFLDAQESLIGKDNYVLKLNESTGIISLQPESGGGGSGESNTASNLGGSGEGLFAQKNGVDLEFKELIAGTNISLSSDANGITINSTGAAFNDYVDDVTLNGTVLEFTNNDPGGLSVAFNDDVDLSGLRLWRSNESNGRKYITPIDSMEAVFVGDDFFRATALATDSRFIGIHDASITSSSSLRSIYIRNDSMVDASTSGVEFGLALSNGVTNAGVVAYQDGYDSGANLGLKFYGITAGVSRVERMRIAPSGVVEMNAYIGSFEDVTDIVDEHIVLFDSGGNIKKAAALDALVSDDVDNAIILGGDGRLWVSNAIGGGADGNNFVNAASFNNTNNVLTGTGTGGAGFTVDLSDLEQDLSLSSNTLSLTGDATTVDLSAYLDNTDSQDLSVSGANNTATFSLTGDASFIELKTRRSDLLGVEVSGQEVFLEPEYVHGANMVYNFSDAAISNGTSVVEYPMPVLTAAVSTYYDWIANEINIWVDGTGSCDLEIVDEGDVVLGTIGAVSAGKTLKSNGIGGYTSISIPSDAVVRLKASNVSGTINNIHATLRLITDIN